MKKLLRPQDIFLLGLASVADIFEEFRDPGGFVSMSYKNMYGFVPQKYKRNNYRNLVCRSLKTGYIEKIIKNGEPYLSLSVRGSDRVKRDFPLFSIQKKVWDKKWRILFFDIEEVNKHRRELLREKLKELGFGMLQKSVFISPHDFVKDLIGFLQSFNLSDYVYIIEVNDNGLLSGNIKSSANNIWKLDQLNEKYKELAVRLEEERLTLTRYRIKKFNGREKTSNRKGGSKDSKINSKIKESKIKEIYEDYLRVLVRDPFLPSELLPDGWMGHEANLLIKKILK